MFRRRDLLWLAAGCAAGPATAAASVRVVDASLSGPSRHYDHAALGSTSHPTALRVNASDGRTVHALTYALPAPFVFEDRLVRVADLDRDGWDEVFVVRSSPQEGARLAMYRIDVRNAAR